MPTSMPPDFAVSTLRKKCIVLNFLEELTGKPDIREKSDV